MTKKEKPISKQKVGFVVFLGFVLLFSSLRFLMNLQVDDSPAEIQNKDFITFKEGTISFLDKKGYNFAFFCEINDIKVIETKQIQIENQIVIESENSFGFTQFIFDRFENGDTKFSINHQGNLERDYKVEMIIDGSENKKIANKNVISWDTGHFDYSDMKNETSLMLNRDKNNDFVLSVKFEAVVDFYVDPVISTEILDSASVTRYDEYFTDIPENITTSLLNASDLAEWNQFTTDNESLVGLYNPNLLQNGDFDQLYESGIASGYIDNAYASWYALEGSPKVNGYDSDVVGRWRLENESTTTVKDYSGNGNNGSMSQVGWNLNTPSSLSSNSLYQGTGTSGRLEFTDSDDFTFGNGSQDKPFSISVWFRNTDLDYMDGVILGKLSSSLGYEWESKVLTPSYLLMWRLFNNTVGTTYMRVMSDEQFAINTWYFLTLSYNGNGTDEGLSIYWNGTDHSDPSERYTSADYVAMNNANADVTAFANDNGGDQLRKSYLDEITLWNRSFTLEEHQELFNMSPLLPQDNEYIRGNSSNVVDIAENTGEFFDNKAFVSLSPNDSIAQDLYVDSSEITHIQFDFKNYAWVNVTDSFIGLNVTLEYEDGNSSFQMFNESDGMYWCADSNVSNAYPKKVFTNVSYGKIITRLSFTNLNLNWSVAIDNVLMTIGIANPDFEYQNGSNIPVPFDSFRANTVTAPTEIHSGSYGLRLCWYNSGNGWYYDGWIESDVNFNSNDIVSFTFWQKLYEMSNTPNVTVTMIYSDSTNTTQRFIIQGHGAWSQSSFTNITADKIVDRIRFERFGDTGRWQWSSGAIDEIEIQISSSYTSVSDNDVLLPTGLTEWKSWYGAERPYLLDQPLLADGDRSVGIFDQTDLLNLSIMEGWIIEVNLTINPESDYYLDYGFAGGFQLHFLDSANVSLACMDLIDNNTYAGSNLLGGSLFYNTSSSSSVRATDFQFDSGEWNVTNKIIKIKKVYNSIYIMYPDSLTFGDVWIYQGLIEDIFGVADPLGYGIKFVRFNSSRSVDYPDRNATDSMYYSDDSDFFETFNTSLPLMSRTSLASPFYINSWNITTFQASYESNQTTVTGDWIGNLNNASSQVIYTLNYSIEPPSSYEWTFHNQSFYVPKSYDFYALVVNGFMTTLGEEFTITSFNASHNLYVYDDGLNNGSFLWWFLTNNSIAYFEINPNVSNGTLTNHSLSYYYVRVEFDGSPVENEEVKVEVKYSDETIIFNETKFSGVGGWINSSIDQNFEMLANHKFYITVTGVNQSFLGYKALNYTAYNDWTAPVIDSVDYEDRIDKNFIMTVDVAVSDDWTLTGDLTVTMFYSFVSSAQLDTGAVMAFSIDRFTVSIAGQQAETTIWFKIQALDNVSNVEETSVFQADWIEPIAETPSGAGNGGGGNGAVTPVASSGNGGSNWMLILVFIAGAVMVAILGYAVMKRVTVRTRKVETREVTTVLGRYGKSQEKIVEKGV